MTAMSTGPLQALRPQEVATYLRVHGWRQDAELNGKGSLWLLGPAGDRTDADLTLPLRRDLGNYDLRMGEVLRTLRQVEGRPEAEILQDLLTTSSDLIRVRAPSREAESGSLPFDQAVAFVGQARNLVLAAARAAVSKRSIFPTRKPALATDYLARVRTGQTERGSYVLTILFPVAPALVSQPELPLDAEPPEDPRSRLRSRAAFHSELSRWRPLRLLRTDWVPLPMRIVSHARPTCVAQRNVPNVSFLFLPTCGTARRAPRTNVRIADLNRAWRLKNTER